ncbi:hypothetical protein SAMD00019534_112900 [Acytostelium subglobosum LB1]|uniref:hypothetical protein n=1 Tax=Acytostelium subglobosum LB1 TaxID=1410327 RepID=UPI0006451C68|nr:hypothetical protein SAMD00019534_112900 [Acytostelium subglobosum LB1]GAM28114.1 hypothetical protein SAMD00019534_112900 [Acytostelium subglobosum LB1]|eukprot:XP_012749073.1 hypothetical protein SAMD00019534_112900 [Acytostelium subglobosum LB1]
MVETNGGKVLFSLLPYGTDFVVVIDDHNQNASIHPNLQYIYDKATKYKVPIVSDKYVYDSVSATTLKSTTPYQFILDTKMEAVDDNTTNISEELSSNLNSTVLDDNESFNDMFDLFSNFDDPVTVHVVPTSSPALPTQPEALTEDPPDIFDMNIESPYHKNLDHDIGNAFIFGHPSDGSLEPLNPPNRTRALSVSPSGLMTYINMDRQLYCWGVDANRTDRPTRATPHSTNNSTAFVDVASTKDNIVAVDSDGHCWEIIIQSVQKGRIRLQPLAGLSVSIRMVSCGKEFCAALTEAGRIVTWGTNDLGQLGRHTPVSRVKHHINSVGYIDSMNNVTTVCSGDNHTLAINSSNDVYGWGSNNHHQLLAERIKFQVQPTLIPHDGQGQTRPIKVFCNVNYTIIINGHGVQSFGYIGVIEPRLETLKQMNLHQHLDHFELFKYKSEFGFKIINPCRTAHYLITLNNPELLQAHLSTDLSLLSKDNQNELIHHAITQNSLKSLQVLFRLFDSYANPECLEQTNTKLTPLHSSVRAKSHDIQRYLLGQPQFILYINATDSSGNTPLHYAVQSNSTESMRLLLEKGCDRNVKNTDGQTSLHLAVKSNNISLPMLLLRHGAQSMPDRFMKTPLQYATAQWKPALQKIMFDNPVFLSYAHKDIKFVRELRVGLETYSIRCWLDEYRLQAGCDWREEITKGVENAQVIVYTVSETSSISLWCRKELKMARKLGKTIIAIYLHDVEVDPILKGLFDFELKPHQSPMDFGSIPSEQWLEHFERLSKVIKSVLGGSKLQRKRLAQMEINSNYPHGTIYFSFSNSDLKLFNLIREMLLLNGLPVIDREQIFGNLDTIVADQDTKGSRPSLDTTKQSKRGMRLITKYSFTQDIFDFETEVPIIQVYNGVSSDGKDDNSSTTTTSSSLESLLMATQHESDFFAKGTTSKEVDQVRPYINKCLLHLVLFTDDSSLPHVMKELEMARQMDKQLLVLSTDISHKRRCPDILKGLTWVIINYQQEEEFIEKIMFMYELLYRTHTLTQKVLHKLKSTS